MRILLKCGIGAILGGLLLATGPDPEVRWRGFGAMGIGGVAMALWFWKFMGNEDPKGREGRGRRSAPGPRFEAQLLEDPAEDQSTSRLVRKVRGMRQEQTAAVGGGPAGPIGDDLDDADPFHLKPSASYLFAHKNVREFAFNSPAKCVAAMSGPGAQEILRGLWELSQSQSEPQSAPMPASFPVHQVQFGQRQGVVIELPRPERAPEAYFVALVLDPPGPAGRPPQSGLPGARYFTLEKCADLFASLRNDPASLEMLQQAGLATGEVPETVLCEWRPDGSHVNHGPGPDPDPVAFQDNLAYRLADDGVMSN